VFNRITFTERSRWRSLATRLPNRLENEQPGSIFQLQKYLAIVGGFGARWEYEQAFWQKDDVVAFAKIKVATIGGSAIRNPATNLPDTEGIEVTITDAEHAKLPSTLPNSLD
jgi:hypothetical protein